MLILVEWIMLKNIFVKKHYCKYKSESENTEIMWVFLSLEFLKIRVYCSFGSKNNVKLFCLQEEKLNTAVLLFSFYAWENSSQIVVASWK